MIIMVLRFTFHPQRETDTMHEASLARSLVYTMNDIASRQGALGVVAARIRLDGFSGISTKGLNEQFIHLSKGTRAEGALLKVRTPDSDIEDSYGAARGLVLESIELRLELSTSL